ncbi:MAG: S4 domain-containing protein, partial [Alphaproteobacteria bacterium]|nr:S4 domain-containing protein [Alphaproteobacteria bacterium]
MTSETISESGEQRKLVVSETDAGLRLDQFLARASDDLSRSRLKALIVAGHVAVNDIIVQDPSAKVLATQAVSVLIPPAIAPVPQGQAMDLTIAFEDDDVIVIDKPAGLVVHPAAGNADRTLV